MLCLMHVLMNCHRRYNVLKCTWTDSTEYLNINASPWILDNVYESDFKVPFIIYLWSCIVN